MSQLHWMISLIPDAVLNWIYILIILAGVSGVLASWLARWIPFYGNYAKFLKPLGIVLIVLGVYLKGGYDTEMAWREKVEEMQAKVAQAEEKSKEANVQIKTVVKERVKVIHDTQIVVREKIKQDAAKMDADCRLDPVVVEDLNQAAGGKKK